MTAVRITTKLHRENCSHALLIISLPLPLKYLASCSYRNHNVSINTNSMLQKCKKWKYAKL